MKSPIQQRSHLIKEVTLPSLTFNPSPISNTEMFELGGELAKEVVFVFIFLFLY